MSTIEERVARGAAWLDARKAGWLDRIDLAELEMASGKWCIAGQLWGLFPNRPKALAAGWDFGLDVASYDRSQGAIRDEFRALTAEWRRVITERRAAA